MEAFPGAVILFDADLTIVEWNATAGKMYGYTKSEIRGKPLPTVPPDRAGELRDLMKRVAAGETILDLETTRLTASGQPFEVQLSLLPFHEAGAPYFLEVTADIRERVRWRKTMMEVEKLTSMGKMAAGTAHHLNSPIAALLLRVQMMRERNDNAGMAADFDRLEDGLKFCRQFVQRLLEYTRGDPARKQVQPLDSTLESVAAFFQPAMAARDVKFSSDISASEGLSIFADRSLVEVLLLTLLSNALDAVPAGGEIRLSCRAVSNGEIEIAVADTGCGISEANLAKVFEPFFTTKEPGKGTGLGLAIVKNLVTEHGGSIRLVSKPGEGTAALVQLPLCPALPLVDGGGIEAKH
jgi:PAS domain S-box-containing protein